MASLPPARLPARAPALWAAAVLAVLVLAGCSTGGGSAGELTTSPSVAANGKHYSYGQSSVAQSRWPAACSLLTTDSVAAAVGTAVAASTFHQRCYYIPGNDAFPTLTLTILGIGDGQRSAFSSVRRANSSNSPSTVDGVGKAAITYAVPGSPTVNLDLLADQGLFELSLRSPVGNETSASVALSMLRQVGGALATEFAG